MSANLERGGTRNKLEAALLFTVQMAEKLLPGDTVSVVSFNSQATTILSPTEVTTQISSDLNKVLASLRPNGGTSISAGLETAALVARNAKEIRVQKYGKDAWAGCRLVLLTDMSDREVTQAKFDICRITCSIAKEDIFVSYVGLGEDFKQELTEQITVAEGCNYFCVLNEADYANRIVNEIASSFFPDVTEMQLLLITKQYEVTGVYGAGKDEKEEKPDTLGWNQDTQHLYNEATQEAVQQLRTANLPNDMVGAILAETQALDGSEKPIVLLTEKSVFPSPTSSKPGYQKGGWVIVALEPSATKGEVAGFVRVELHYRTITGDFGKCVKEVSLAEIEELRKSGGRNWYSSEGMGKALVLKQYVDVVKATLGDKTRKVFPEEFLVWFEEQAGVWDLKEEKEKIAKLKPLLEYQ